MLELWFRQFVDGPTHQTAASHRRVAAPESPAAEQRAVTDLDGNGFPQFSIPFPLS